jgi:hypothetical protein
MSSEMVESDKAQSAALEMESARKAVGDLRVRLMDRLAGAHRLDSFDVEELWEAEQISVLWGRVEWLVLHKDFSLVEAIIAVRKDATEQLLGSSMDPATTSQAQVAISFCDRKATRYWVDHTVAYEQS